MTEQEKREKVIKGLEHCIADNCDLCPYDENVDCPGFDPTPKTLLADVLALLKAQEPITGETSDGYHTFNELYHHRAVLFSVIVANYKDRAWKSVRHHDGTMYDGMFIVGIDTPDGQATYHYDINPYWDMFDCKVREYAPEWDGHTPAQAIERIGKLKAQEPRVMTLEEVLALKFDDVVYVEVVPTHAVLSAIVLDVIPKLPKIGIGVAQFRYAPTWNGINNADLSYYGKTWRCWTSRPTDAQREKEPWNG